MNSNLLISIVKSAVVALAIQVFTIGCSDDATSPNTNLANPNEDVAESVASSLGNDNGGAADQIDDLVALAKGNPQMMAKAAGAADGLIPAALTYDQVTGTWTQDFVRERGSQSGAYYAYIARTYQWQFRKSDGTPQIGYVVGNDTANSISFTIVSGNGRHRTPRLSQALTELKGSLLANNTHTNTVTINGEYLRSAVDTIRTRNAVRTIDHTLRLNFDEIVINRLSADEAWEGMSGSINGVFVANVTFTAGEAYSETNITREIDITVSNGEADILVNGARFRSRLQTGELSGN